MIKSIFAIARNTFIETLRQPAFYLVILLSSLLIIFSRNFAMFSLLENIKMVKDMGLATILLSGLIISVLNAAAVVSNEIENKTALTDESVRAVLFISFPNYNQARSTVMAFLPMRYLPVLDRTLPTNCSGTSTRVCRS